MMMIMIIIPLGGGTETEVAVPVARRTIHIYNMKNMSIIIQYNDNIHAARGGGSGVW